MSSKYLIFPFRTKQGKERAISTGNFRFISLHFFPVCEKLSIAVMKKILLSLAVTVVMVAVADAQDPNFSQFFASPLTLNPALTGKFDGTMRVAGNYRNQWPAFNNVYTTSTISLDFPIMQKRIPEFDTWGVGFMALTDKAAGGVLNNNYFGI